MDCYVCYEENGRDFAAEIGAITDMTVFRLLEDALAWFTERVDLGLKSEFFIDEEAETRASENEIDIEQLKKELSDGLFASVTMFRGKQQNWNESYDITIRKLDMR